MAGDLFYLSVRLLDNPAVEHSITCSINGFFRNDSNERQSFNPAPWSRGSPCYSYTLAGCLHQLSPQFSKNLQTYLGSILETEPYFLATPVNARHHWISSSTNKIKVSNSESIMDTANPLYGADPKMARDWNEEF